MNDKPGNLAAPPEQREPEQVAAPPSSPLKRVHPLLPAGAPEPAPVDNPAPEAGWGARPLEGP